MSPSTRTASTQQASATKPLDGRPRSSRRAVPSLARKTLASVVLLTATFGFVGTTGAAATDCNKLYGAGHGYWGCDGIDHAWDHGTWDWVLYFW